MSSVYVHECPPESPAQGKIGSSWLTEGKRAIRIHFWTWKSQKIRFFTPSKYLPAKPGALVLEPLKAAYPCRTSQASLPLCECSTPHELLNRCSLGNYSFLLLPSLGVA
jgi:hypothetical protein